MSEQEQRAQYNYGRTIAEVMTNPNRNISEIISMAATMGKDIVFGESHDATATTMNEINKLVEGLPKGSIKAIALEFPPDLQVLFEPSTIQSLSPKEFLIQGTNIAFGTMEESTKDLLQAGKITEEQFDYLNDLIEESLPQILAAITDETAQDHPMTTIYEMARKAASEGIPVIAADKNTDRMIAAVLNSTDDPDLHMSNEDYVSIFSEGLDDTSDVELLANMGIDINSPGILIAQRGALHINDSFTEKHKDILGNVNRQGFDDILEQKGRNVLTVGVLSETQQRENLQTITPDPTDFTVIVYDNGNEILDRDKYMRDTVTAERKIQDFMEPPAYPPPAEPITPPPEPEMKEAPVIAPPPSMTMPKP